MKYLSYSMVGVLIFTSISCGNSVRNRFEDSFASINNPTVGAVTSSAFYVRVFDQNKFPFFMHRAGSFGTSCEIDASISSQDYTCIIEMNEGDIYEQDLYLQYNLPGGGYCDYFTFYPYWYYNYPVGTGPTNIDVTITKDADGNITATTCTVDSVTTTPCDPAEASFDPATAQFTCDYDYTKAGFPNCCDGSYVQTTRTITPGGTSVATSASTAWAPEGWVKNCIGGPPSTNWPASGYTLAGYPARLSYFIRDNGLNQIYQLPRVISNPNSGTVTPVANYFGDVSHTHTGYVLGTSTSSPYAIAPIDDVNGSPVRSGNPAYSFECRDKAFEIKNRIRLYIRSWNTYANFVAYGTSSGVTYNPNVEGEAGVDCTAVNTEENCNNFTKWDSVFTFPSASNAFVGPYTSGNRANYFPFEYYRSNLNIGPTSEPPTD